MVKSLLDCSARVKRCLKKVLILLNLISWKTFVRFIISTSGLKVCSANILHFDR